jgi:uncharacterized membrane protein
LSQRAATALVFLLAGLLAVVIIVGLVERSLGLTGVVEALSTLLTGVVGGMYLRGKTPPGGGDK